MTVLHVNGRDHEVVTHPSAALLWVLRDELGSASAKYGCGVGQCGACRVLIDGTPAFSCAVTLEEAEGHDVTTLEALLHDARAARVAAALIERDAAQCGYCLPGMVVTLTALAMRSNAVSRTDVVRALDSHLCRCGAHTRILTAACAALEIADE
jgi:aerobic-type carbon monoxide dehydrogenase small subunit (CoxS/CutS family)